MFGWEFPPHISGGLGTACYGLTYGLTHHGVKVLFVLPKVFGDEGRGDIRFISAGEMYPGAMEGSLEMLSKMTFIGIESALSPYISAEEYELQHLHHASRTASGQAGQFRFSGTYGWNLIQEVFRYGMVAGSIARKFQFDIIHAHDWLTYPAGIIAKKVSGKPLVVHVHATEFDRSGENINQDVYDIEKMGMEAADKVIAVSEFTKGIVTGRYGIPHDKVVAVHNAVIPKPCLPKEKIRKYPGDRIVTFLGRVTFQKGPDYFVEVARKILKRDKNVRFVMAGDGDMLRQMIRRVAHLKMGTRFHFTGFLKGAEVDEMFALSDVYVMPSVSEPFGIAPLEAIRWEVPAVISKQSGVAEVLHHAVKVDFWDTDKVADAVYALLNYEPLSKKIIEGGKAEVENLTWEKQAYKVKLIYESLLNRN